MKPHFLNSLAALLAIAAMTSCNGTNGSQPTQPLKSALEGKFLIGTAMNTAQIEGTDAVGLGIITTQFNSVVAENCMKTEKIHPEEGVYAFDLADRFVDFGEAHGMFIVGHALVWHSQLPAWFTVDAQGNEVTRDVLIARMKDHIFTLMERYKGRVHGWDVVNEAFEDDGSFRQSPFYRIIGEEYIQMAFEFAAQADPGAELYYNDFSTAAPGKREAIVSLVQNLQAAGVRIDAVGMQGHITMDFPTPEAFEKSLLAFAAQGVDVMITELDLSVLPSVTRSADIGARVRYDSELDPYTQGLPEAAAKKWESRLESFFDVFIRNSDKISRVTLWGISDKDSWRNDFPMLGRTDYALLYDRNDQPKPIVEWIVKRATQK